MAQPVGRRCRSEIKYAVCARRKLYGNMFGQGFDSLHLHQRTLTFCMSKKWQIIKKSYRIEIRQLFFFAFHVFSCPGRKNDQLRNAKPHQYWDLVPITLKYLRIDSLYVSVRRSRKIQLSNCLREEAQGFPAVTGKETLIACRQINQCFLKLFNAAFRKAIR